MLVNQRTKILSKKRDIHDFGKKIDNSLVQIKRELSPVTFDLLEKYYKTMVRDGIKTSTRSRELSMTIRLSNKILRCKKCNFQKKEWSNVTKHDIDDFVTNLMERYSDDGAETEYTRDHKKTLKSFFRWTKYGFRSKEDCINEYGVGDPPETRHVKKRNPDSKLRASDLITDQEREWLLDACDHPMDAFLVDVPLDAGLRPGEIFNVTIGDIKQDKYGFKMDVEGKTGIRPVRLVKSTPTIARWLNSHPLKENRDAPILISLKKSTFGEPLRYAAANKRLKRICEKARKKHSQFTKRIYLTLMRHTDATESAKFLSEGITRKKHGWSKNSPMPNRYSHLVNSDVDEKILEHYGIHNEIERPQVPQKCSTCEMFNPINSTMCSKCGKPLDLQTAIELEEKEKEEKTKLEKKLGEIDELKEQLARKEQTDKFREQEMLDKISKHVLKVMANQNTIKKDQKN